MIGRRALTALSLCVLMLGACATEAPTTVVVAGTTGVCDSRFRVVNRSATTVLQLFFSSSSLSGWGQDQLGSAVLPPGGVSNYRAANAGNYDFRVVFADGRATELRQINICAASQITVTERGLLAS